MLDAVGVTLPVAREAIQPTLELSPAAASRSAVVSPLARRILSRSLSECSRRASESLTAIDLLRALLKDRNGGAAQTLDRLGVEPGRVKAEIDRLASVGQTEPLAEC